MIMLHASVTLLTLNMLSSTTADEPVIPYRPVLFSGHDIMEFWNSNSSVIGNIPMNITSKDENGISRAYQLWFSSLENLEKFKQNQTHYMPQYGGF